MIDSLGSLVDASRVLTVVGAGGVGKTSTAAALASAGAGAGRRVCLVTVDPARRLADALGGPRLGPTPSRLEAPGTNSGELWAMMLDPKVTFDTIVRQHSDTEQQVEDVLGNGFYQKLSTSLPGVHEYMAIEQLRLLSDDPRFDLVVVDTPPAHHVVDLVDAPERLTRFLDNRMYRTLIRPAGGMARIAAAPARAFTKRVASVVGGQLLDDAIVFFEAFAGMEAGFVERATAVRHLLEQPTTAFIAVATPRRDSVQVALELADTLQQRRIRVAGTIANMTTFDPWDEVEPWLPQLGGSPELRLRTEALRDRHERAEAEAELLRPLVALEGVHGVVHRRPGEVADLAGLAAMGSDLVGTAGG
ncbi:MAG: ArsA-related P-loop ATPase [Actinomycetota bacterium]|jgi:anion-transporting  ArsA/GET3 family ATPase|nr:ArsA-related P-loop ATPase [Actinomycetota bacterium]